MAWEKLESAKSSSWIIRLLSEVFSPLRQKVPLLHGLGLRAA